MTKLLFATLLAFTALPALAEPPAVFTSIVETADLNLSSEAGQRALDRRLALAAKEVCGAASNADLVGQNEARRCRKAVLAKVDDDREQRIAAASNQPIEVASR